MQRKKKQSPSQSNKVDYWYLYLQFSIQLRLYLDDVMVDINQFFKSIFVILQSIQQLSFVFDNYYFEDEHHLGFKKFFISIAKFTRPYIICNKTWNKYMFLIPMAILLLYFFISLFLFVNFLKNKKQKKIGEIVNKQKRIFIIILQSIGYYQSLIYYITFVPQVEMTLISLIFFLDELNAAACVIIIILFLLMLFNSFYHLHCIQQSIYIRVKNLNMLNLQFSHYLNLILILLIISLNQTSFEKSIKFYLIVSVVLIKQIVNIFTIYTALSNARRRTLIDLGSEVSTLIVTFILLFMQLVKWKSNSQDYETIFIIILVPIAIQIFQISFSDQNNQLMLIKDEYLPPLVLQYKISSIIDDFFWIRNSFVNNNNLIIEIQQFKEYHISNCQIVKCICNIQDLTFEQIIRLYLKDLVNYFYYSLDKVKIQSFKSQYFIHYLSLVQLLGLSTQAFQQSNILIQQDSDNYSSSISKTLGLNVNEHKSNSSIDHQNSGKRSKVNQSEEKIRVKIDDMSFVQKQRLIVIQESIKKTLSTGLGRVANSVLSDSLEHAVKLFLKSEESNQLLKNKIVKMINRKKDFFINLSLKNEKIKLFDQAKTIIVKLTQLEDELMKLYLQFPSRKMQALNTFYQSEVMNNYFQAFKLATVTAISDDKLFKMQSQISFDLFSSKLDYLIIGFDEKTHKMQIRQSSNQIHQFFGLNQEKFKYIKNIEHLLPSQFEQIHGRLVQNFLQAGHSKYFRSININYCRFQQSFIKPIDLFYDINVTNLEDLTFACFLQNNETQNAFIFCCQSNKIQGITKNFIQKLGYPPKLISKLNESLMRQPLQRMFPSFSQFSETYLSDHQEITKEQFDQSEYQVQMNVPEINFLLNDNQKVVWDLENNFAQYHVDVVFHYRKNKEENNNYLIIEIREAKKSYKTISTPQETEHITPNQKMSESQRYPESLGRQNSEDFKDLDLFEDFELQANVPRAIEFIEPDKQLINFDDDPSESHFCNRPKPQDNSQLYPNVSLISPKDATSKLIDVTNKNQFYETNTKRFSILRQQFFQSQDQKDISSNAEDVSQQNEKDENIGQNQIDKMQFEDIDQDLQENLKMQMQIEEQNQNIVAIDDVGSQISSVAAFKKSKYSKKYDLIQKLIKSERFSLYFYLTRILMTGLLIVFFIFSIIEIIYSSDDLNRFLAELDMIQIKSNIIGPIDNYIVSQNAVIDYTVLNMIGLMDSATQKIKQDYALKDITYNYQALKDSYIKQLSNQYLNPFFNDQYMSIMMSEVFNTSKREISTREAIYLLLEAAYEFDLIDYVNIFSTLDITSGFFVYLFGNYEGFYKSLTDVNEAMLNYTVQRALSVQQKWIILIIPILIVGFIILILINYFYGRYLQQYNQFLSLFSNIELVWLQRDIDRYKGIASLVGKDSDVLFKYQFDIDLKERFLAAEEIRKEKLTQNQNQKQSKSKAKQNYLDKYQVVSRVPSFIIFSIVYSICFGITLISTNLGESYVNKYPSTTTFFNQLNQISIAATGVFSQRQIIYVVQQKSFFFITSPTFFLDVFQQHIEEIDSFLQLMSNFDSSNLITTSAFIEQIDSLMQSDVCLFLPSYKIESAQIHCDEVYNGVPRRGLQAGLNTVRNSLLNEKQTSKDFSLQIYTLSEQLEIGLIFYDALQNVKTQFQSELVNFTNQLINQILIINVSAIIAYILSVTIMFFIITKVYYKEFRIVIKFVMLMPQTSLFLDNQLDRNLKQIIVKNNLF